MGTSASNPGRGDRPALLPAWALPAQSPDAPPNPPADPNQLPQQPTPQQVLAPPAPNRGPWRDAGSRMGRLASGDAGGRAGLSRAGRGFVRALGGSRQASRSSSGSRAAAARFAGFVSGIQGAGLRESLRRLGLERLVGGDPHVAFAAIADALCPEGATADEAIARAAIVDALAVLWASYVEDTGDLTRLENLDAPAVQESIRTAVVSHVYRRWLFELGKRLESKAVSAEEAARLERDIKRYLDEEIRIDFGDQDLTRVEWDAHDGQSYIEGLFRRAYEILES